MRNNLGTFAIGVIYLAIIYTLVRPGSSGATVVASALSAFTDLVRGVAGQTYDSSTKTWSTGNG